MAAGMRIIKKLILSKVAIKPFSPTPSHLKAYNLSLTDNYMPPTYIPLVFFYPYKGSNITITSHQEKATQQLKKSLSQTLTKYYPFSGKLVASTEGSYVDCNDEGVEFIEARVSAQLSQVVEAPYQSLDLFFPASIKSQPYSNILKVQLSYFDCGGLAVAVLLSHKIGDACTLFNFIKHWATVSHNNYSTDQAQNCSPGLLKEQLQAAPPYFLSFEKSKCSEFMMDKGKNCVYKSFIFPNTKIEKLKAEVIKAQPNIKNPTRVEVVNSLLHICAVKAAKANRPTFFKPYFLIQSVNMRKRFANQLQETTAGNFSNGVTVPTLTESQLTLHSLTAGLKMAKSKITGITTSELHRWEKLAILFEKYVPKNYFQLFLCTSLCGYPVYKIDFGWGKASKVILPGPDKFFILLDTPEEDGIEAIVSLEEEDMEKFQVDEQLLAYAFVA